MAVDSTNVRVGYLARAFVGAVGSTAPTTPFMAWDAAFHDMGYLSDTGLVEGNSRELNEFYAHGYPSAPVRTQVTKEDSTFSVTFIEKKADVLSVYYSVPLTSMTSVVAVSPDPQFVKWTKSAATAPDVRALGIDIVDDQYLHRFIIPRAQITDRADVTYSTTSLQQYQVTFKALQASDGTSIQHMVTRVSIPT